jgi:hypothetical protein
MEENKVDVRKEDKDHPAVHYSRISKENHWRIWCSNITSFHHDRSEKGHKPAAQENPRIVKYARNSTCLLAWTERHRQIDACLEALASGTAEGAADHEGRESWLLSPRFF